MTIATDIKFWDLVLHITHSAKSRTLLGIDAAAPHFERIPLLMVAGSSLATVMRSTLERYKAHYPFCEVSVVHKPRPDAHETLYQEYLATQERCYDDND